MNYFTTNDNFDKIISNVFKSNDVSYSIIPTGWTNIVLDIKIKNNKYIAKLPRNDFWSKQIIKDCNISNFVKNTLHINTPEMSICYDNNRPFSIHKKIQGVPLTSKIKSLSKDNKQKIAKQLANYISNLHTFNTQLLPDYCQQYFTDFLSEMTKLSNNYEMEYFAQLFKDMNDTKNLVFSHNDLNIGNILLNENNDITAIIDWSFAGICDIYTDLSVLSCRSDVFFYQQFIKEYENIRHITLDINKLKNRIDLRKHIEDVYIQYMKDKHPDVKV